MKPFLLSTLALAMISVPAAAATPAPIEGRWSNPKDSVIVKVARCGANYCGRVAWASAKAKAKAGKPLVGSQLMSGFRPDGRGGYKGRVFLPRHNVYAPATIRSLGPDTLSVKGCALSGVMCKEQRWSRVG